MGKKKNIEIKNLANQGYSLKQMIAMIEKESFAQDISEEERHKMAFLNGFLRGTFGNDEAREHNIKTAVSICRKIEFKYMEKPKGKVN